jgi:hypothetical protein
MLRVLPILLALTPATLRAETVHGTSETLLNIFPDPVQRELRIVAPFMEWVTLRAEKLGGLDLSVQLSGWGGFDLGNAWFPGRGGGDLSLAHLAWRDAQKGMSLTLGRQYLLLGMARAEHFDGLHFAKDLPAGFKVEVFGGAHAGPQMTYQAGDWMAGGRLSHRWGDLITTGVSFLQAREREALQRELVGGDVVVRPKPWIELGAGLLYDTLGYHLAQLNLQGTFFPLSGMRVMLDWRRVVPVSLLDKTSIFSVFSDAVRNEAGGDVSYRLSRWVSVGAEGYLLHFDDGNDGYRFGANTRVALDSRGMSSFTFRVGRWRDTVNSYTEFRAAARYFFTQALFGALDLQAYFYDQRMGGVYSYDQYRGGDTKSFGTTAAIGYDLTKRLRALLAVEAGLTPQFERRAQLLAKLEYNFLKAF